VNRRSLFLSLLWLAACAREGYVAITVKLGPLAGQVDQLVLQAFDARTDAGPDLIPSSGPLAGGIPDDAVIAVRTPLGNSLTVIVQGLGIDGGILGAASGSIASATATTTLVLSLSPPCDSPRDCDPGAVCAGSVACSLGVCQSTTAPIAPGGAPCGPSDGGVCDGNGICLLPYCGTGLHPLPPGEQCDEGAALNGNLPDHCRANCRLPSCGDGVVDPDAGELCDLGDRNGQGLGCNATCDLRGEVAVLAGNGAPASLDGLGLDAGFGQPGALAILGNGLFVADQLTRLIRRIDLSSLQVTTIAGGFDGGVCQDTNGQGAAASFCLVSALLAYNDGLLVGDVSSLRFVTPQGEVSDYAGILPSAEGAIVQVTTGPFATSSYGGPEGLALLPPDIYSSTILAGEVLRTDPLQMRTSVASVPFPSAQGGGLTAWNGELFAGDLESGIVAAIDPDGGAATQVAQGLNQPAGLCASGRAIYVAESGAGTVRELVWDGGGMATTLLAGGGADAGFLQPQACAYDSARGVLYVSDPGSNLILVVH
jgi:hypothetical protein